MEVGWKEGGIRGVKWGITQFKPVTDKLHRSSYSRPSTSQQCNAFFLLYVPCRVSTGYSKWNLHLILQVSKRCIKLQEITVMINKYDHLVYIVDRVHVWKPWPASKVFWSQGELFCGKYYSCIWLGLGWLGKVLFLVCLLSTVWLWFLLLLTVAMLWNSWISYFESMYIHLLSCLVRALL